MVTEDNLTLGGEYTVQHADDTLWNCTLEAYNFIRQCHPNTFHKVI